MKGKNGVITFIEIARNEKGIGLGVHGNWSGSHQILRCSSASSSDDFVEEHRSWGRIMLGLACADGMKSMRLDEFISE